ncbi:hypothetical protein CUMW_287490 [Citrus unshiu]|uniref:Uncharacterized protein n=1 Tax=Citrus unshiu TaxID=55188 RepID=A0A2H5MXA8_CITUN|nr:hypothetical protein CUMW_287490 [Citrus unshiu]
MVYLLSSYLVINMVNNTPEQTSVSRSPVADCIIDLHE